MAAGLARRGLESPIRVYGYAKGPVGRRADPPRRTRSDTLFVLRGELEIIVPSSDGLTMGRVARLGLARSWGNSRFSTAGLGRPPPGR